MAQRTSQKVGASRYKQVRLTFTEQSGGKCSYSVYAKGLNQAWDEHQVIARGVLEGTVTHLSTEDVMHTLIAILRSQLLPGSLD